MARRIGRPRRRFWGSGFDNVGGVGGFGGGEVGDGGPVDAVERIGGGWQESWGDRGGVKGKCRRMTD